MHNADMRVVCGVWGVARADPEILERRYPVVLRRFCLRQGSGGEGQYKGGDGVIREVGVSFGQLCSKAGYIMPMGK